MFISSILYLIRQNIIYNWFGLKNIVFVCKNLFYDLLNINNFFYLFEISILTHVKVITHIEPFQVLFAQVGHWQSNLDFCECK